jgi:hypothetical protein
VLTHLYPYIQNELEKYAVAMPYVTAEREHGLDPAGYRERDAAIADKTYICAITQLVFCSAYSKESMMEDQIYRRMIAALAKMQQEAIPKVTFSSTYNSLRIVPYSAQGIALQALGLVLNYTSVGTHNPYIKLSETVDIRTLAYQLQITDFAIALHEQIGLVFSGFHMGTLHFAFAALSIIESSDKKLFPRAKEEVPRLKELRAKVGKAPYYGLQHSQPNEAQIKNFPILCSIGVYYHGRTLMEEEQEAWEDYAISGITAHIEHKADVNLSKSYADILPNHNLASLAELAASLTLPDAEKLLERHPQITRDDMYYYMHDKLDDCVWYIHERNNRMEAASAEYRKFIKDEAIRAFDSRYMALQTAASALDDKAARLSAQQYLMDERAKFDKSLRSLTGTLTLFEGALHPSIDDIRVKLKEEYTTILSVVEKMNLPQ